MFNNYSYCSVDAELVGQTPSWEERVERAAHATQYVRCMRSSNLKPAEPWLQVFYHLEHFRFKQHLRLRQKFGKGVAFLIQSFYFYDPFEFLFEMPWWTFYSDAQERVFEEQERKLGRRLTLGEKRKWINQPAPLSAHWLSREQSVQLTLHNKRSRALELSKSSNDPKRTRASLIVFKPQRGCKTQCKDLARH